MSNLNVANIVNPTTADSTPTDNLSKQVCKAWVSFNGTGTVAIRSAYNVSSITDNGSGRYTVNFTTAMEDVNYSTGSSGDGGSDTFGGGGRQSYMIRDRTVSSCQVNAVDDGGGENDASYIALLVFR